MILYVTPNNHKWSQLGAKFVLGPNCMIPYIKIFYMVSNNSDFFIYGIIQFEPKTGLYPLCKQYKQIIKMHLRDMSITFEKKKFIGMVQGGSEREQGVYGERVLIKKDEITL